ncbi:Irc6p NDAI_0B06220 [Naumovozyma dairenensis CBS 421]|uniref:Increased recombination centers protein 6 n=1 Tax=Naumovozyma dairenensis (strain ATCC 10597 / BCRC 20456 / CBS 421 / NBRC 0211 / NRRL Y-12639) TaxID=1071378 RepID=G0W792_NAUDC|nr:hypothetical protein NDAI_0B06220 [Naumovozyma dairenensis CBS 421]CCD23653.1 hypothetical protein NDAI_0B06220 [Naumovozyma dairenensis CBS 421]
MSLPRNKIIITFGKNSKLHSSKSQLISEIFGSSNLMLNKYHEDTIDNIIKNVKWKTKYYEVTIDLFIDQYDDLLEWIDEYTSDSMIDLRNVVAGIIVIDDRPMPQQDLMIYKRLNDCVSTTNSFLIFANTSDYVVNDSIDELYQTLMEYELTSVEVVSLNSCLVLSDQRGEETNEFGETVGIKRIRELIDVHNWDSSCNIQRPETGTSFDGLLAAPLPEDPGKDVDLENIIQKLKQAKLHYQTISDKSDADAYAEELSQELARYL